jgi:hypothetical protein
VPGPQTWSGPGSSDPARGPLGTITRAELFKLPPMITVPLAGQILGLRSRSAAYRAAGRGDLPTVRMCGKLFVPTELVLQKVGLRPAVDAEPKAS